jgi:hypothetical protein
MIVSVTPAEGRSLALPRNKHGIHYCPLCERPIPFRWWPTESEKTEADVVREYRLFHHSDVPEDIKKYYSDQWGRPWKETAV